MAKKRKKKRVKQLDTRHTHVCFSTSREVSCATASIQRGNTLGIRLLGNYPHVYMSKHMLPRQGCYRSPGKKMDSIQHDPAASVFI